MLLIKPRIVIVQGTGSQVTPGFPHSQVCLRVASPKVREHGRTTPMAYELASDTYYGWGVVTYAAVSANCCLSTEKPPTLNRVHVGNIRTIPSGRLWNLSLCLNMGLKRMTAGGYHKVMGDDEVCASSFGSRMISSITPLVLFAKSASVEMLSRTITFIPFTISIL